MRQYLHLLFLGIAAIIIPSRLEAQHEGLIYGEVTLTNDERYTGVIHWSARQQMWVDLLVVEKKNNPLLRYLNNDQLKKLSREEKEKDRDWGFMSLWENKYPSRELTLTCRFGDIDAIHVTGDKEARIVLKNGEKIDVYTGDGPEYRRQLGEDITVNALKSDKMRIKWEDIASVRFLPAPSRLPHFNAVPLYGTVTTRLNLRYTGLVQWDTDERYTSNLINGKTSDGKDARFRLRDVQSIRPKDEGSLIRLYSGKEVYLEDDRDIDGRNRGIIVQHPIWGQVTVGWNDFKGVVFNPYPGGPAFAYNGFGKASDLNGSVRTNDGRTWKGHIVYELDEKLDVETIDGWDRAGALRQVPLRYISKIYPVNAEESAVILKDGSKLVLGGRSDVSETNWGVLVKLRGKEFKYIPWNKVDLVTFEK